MQSLSTRSGAKDVGGCIAGELGKELENKYLHSINPLSQTLFPQWLSLITECTQHISLTLIKLHKYPYTEENSQE